MYLFKYFSEEDIHVYSIDEVFRDITNYMNLYKLESRELVKVIVKNVIETTGITASAELHILSNMVDKIKKV